MALVVHKYGGTSVGTPDRIKNVARRVAKWKSAGHQVVVVVSAMSGETNRLLGLAKEISANPDPREMDVIASTGEQVTIGLLAMALIAGIANTWVRGDSFFGLFKLVSFAPGNKTIRGLIVELHEVPTNLILIVAGVHAAAALFHHFVKRDGVLRRMLPG